uniref:Uncharacterized protein n=1 Tax=Triticum urartu TaxID=4572 RepID=A0A8R7QVN0_TRIUA
MSLPGLVIIPLCQPGKILIAASTIGCHSDLFNCLILSCKPKYLHGNRSIFQGIALLTSSSYPSSALIRMAEDFAKLILSPEASPKICRTSSTNLMPVLEGLINITTSSA